MSYTTKLSIDQAKGTPLSLSRLRIQKKCTTTLFKKKMYYYYYSTGIGGLALAVTLGNDEYLSRFSSQIKKKR